MSTVIPIISLVQRAMPKRNDLTINFWTLKKSNESTTTSATMKQTTRVVAEMEPNCNNAHS